MWRPYKHVTSAYRSVSIPRPYLSTAQACYRKEISLPFTFSNSTLAVGCEEVRGAQARGPDRLRAESPVPGDLPTRSCRVPLGTAPPPQRRQPLFPALAAEAFLRPNATQPPQRTSPSTSASGRLNYKSRQGPREARPLPPPPEKNPRTLREMPGPRNRTKPADGGGEVGVAKDTRDGGLFEGAESPIWLCVFRCPSHNCRARRPRPVPRASGRSRGRFPPSFFADSCQAVCSSQASVPLTPFPPLAQTSGSGTTGASLSSADAETPLRSRFPAAPGADCFRSVGPRRRGEAKPHVAMEMCSGPGEGLSNDNDCFEAVLGLVPSSPGIPAFWVPLERQGKERILPLRQSLRFHKPFHMRYLMRSSQ